MLAVRATDEAEADRVRRWLADAGAANFDG
jgi:hypothetical protein